MELQGWRFEPRRLHVPSQSVSEQDSQAQPDLLPGALTAYKDFRS